MFHACEFLRWLSPADLPRKALEWLLGYEPCLDWYLVSELKRATQKSDKLLMACLTEWISLPAVAPENTPHFSGANPEDRRMLYLAGEASLLHRWEEHPNPRAWIRKIAWCLRARRKREDEAEHIAADKSNIVIQAESEYKKHEEAYGRLGGAINKPEREPMYLATPVNDPFAALLPASKASVEDLHAALDWQKQCRSIGLSEGATRLGLAKIALAKKHPGANGLMRSVDRKLLADLLGIDEAHLEAKEQELRRARAALAERLSIYGLRQDK